MRRRWLLPLLLMLASCASAAATVTAPVSAWGQIITFGQAEQGDAPVLWASSAGVTAVWVGADERGVHHDSRNLTNSGLSGTVVLPLPPVYPFGQQLFPAADDHLHLLWLDANAEGEPRLYTALLSPQLTVIRGPTVVSDRRTLRFAVVPNADGSLWVVFSGGLMAEPGLFAAYVDAQGRPRQQVAPVAANADWPSFAQGADGVVLYWRRPADGRVFRASFHDGAADAVIATTAIPLAAGDRLESLAAAADRTHGYLFWNITRADGQVETGWASGAWNTGDWQAERLGVAIDDASPFITGFNTGTASTAGAGDQWARWASPPAGVYGVLPVAAQVGSALGVIYFQAGRIAGYQTIVENTSLIGLPAIRADRDLFLYLAWAQPNDSGSADLNLTTMRPFGR
ncbi:MAG: hypothetical protein HZC41_16350 [Chloroflexi bacterium]|nr:hypothetical protein [Chloroflexota bacterium]